jgi:hypothetical protein
MAENCDEEGSDEAPPPAPPRRRFRLGKRLLLELVVIVFGVLIALGLENLVQELRWRSEAAELEQLFRDDIEYNLAVATERRAVDACLRHQLESLSTGVAEARGAFSANPYSTALANPMAPVVAEAYRAPLRTQRTASFERALGTEAVKRISHERFLAYAQLFTVFGQMRTLQNEELSAAADLAPLAVDQPDFNPEVRADSLKAIAALDSIRGRLALLSVQTIQDARRDGLAPDRSTLEGRRVGAGEDQRGLRQLLEAQRQGRGACVDIEGSLRLLDHAG